MRQVNVILQDTQRRGVWHRVGMYGSLLLLLVGLVYVLAPYVRAEYQRGQEARAQAAAKEQAAQEAFAASYAKPPWERIPQAAQEDVTEFANDFLRRLGYTLQGEVVYSGWTTTDAWGGAYKQYDYYALIDPAWPPLRLRCGPSGYREMGPLTCYVFPRGE